MRALKVTVQPGLTGGGEGLALGVRGIELRGWGGVGKAYGIDDLPKETLALLRKLGPPRYGSG